MWKGVHKIPLCTTLNPWLINIVTVTHPLCFINAEKQDKAEEIKMMFVFTAHREW